MRLYPINTGWLRAVPASQSFLDAWAMIVNALVGRWGMDNWEWTTGQSGIWRLVKGLCCFSVRAGAGDFTFKLPFTPSADSFIQVCDLTNGTVRGIVILKGMDAVAIHLDNACALTSTYETER